MKTLLLSLCLGVAGCAVSSHQVQKADLGRSSSTAELLAVIDEPGPIVLETINSCDWTVDRSGLIDLNHPTAKAAGLVDGQEPIGVFFHVIRHPTKGTFIVDTGVETALRDRPGDAAPSALIRSYMHLERMKVLQPLGEWIAREPQPISGVFLTHMHLVHITGMADVPATTAIYSGPGEAEDTAFLHLFVQGTSDRALAGKPPVSEWQYSADPTQRFKGVLDVFGDGSVWALWVPGHTPGSTAYVIRTASGPVLLTGDASHTRWGWEHGVGPGTFSGDAEKSATSFALLRAFAAEHPQMEVRVGHQR